MTEKQDEIEHLESKYAIDEHFSKDETCQNCGLTKEEHYADGRGRRSCKFKKFVPTSLDKKSKGEEK